MLAYALQWRDAGHVYVLGVREQLADLLCKNGRNNEALREYSALLRFLRNERPFWTEKIREIEQKLRKNL